jgi:hypothetical protein
MCFSDQIMVPPAGYVRYLFRGNRWQTTVFANPPTAFLPCLVLPDVLASTYFLAETLISKHIVAIGRLPYIIDQTGLYSSMGSGSFDQMQY